MTDTGSTRHAHIFLGEGHDKNERRTWLVIWLCGFMMVAEIVGGLMFGSIALVADGLHMSTHAGALLLAAAKEKSPRGLRLHVFQRNLSARRFYERRGFKLVQLRDGSSNEEGEPDAVYEWIGAGLPS